MIQGATMIGRLGAVLMVVASLTFAACTTSPAEPNPLSAIRAVLTAAGFANSSQTFPEQPGRIACVIQGGGPYPGIRVPGTCQTSVAWNRGLFLVTLTEYWDASAFRGGDTDPSNGQLSYSWRYKVNGTGNVTFVDSSGNFPPGEVS
ncbi:MAG TPA: hypothetical protein DEV93_17080 [Chloroflexi bacterium]|jgi:hypothetical protein|nr:hypothetical protein [Chloroflexota bacterium]